MRFPKEELSFTKLNIRQKRLSDGVCVVLPEGSIDSSNSEEFRDKLDQILGNSAQFLLLDMTNVKYLSSMGLGAIISLMHKSKTNNANLFLYDTQTPVKRVLQIARLDFLEIKPDAVDASNPFSHYISEEEPRREKIRQAREAERKKQEAGAARTQQDEDKSR